MAIFLNKLQKGMVRTVKKIMRFGRILCFAASAAILLSSCGAKGQYAYDSGAPSISEAYKDYFRVGCAVNSWNLDEGSDEYNIIVKQFNTLTLENESKPENLHPSEDKYYFDKFDKFVNFCEDNGIAPRGHTLIWHSQVPGWLFKDGNETASAELLLERIDEHVTTIVSRYKGRVKTWDVVNEVLADDYGLRRSDWYKIVGDYDGDGDEYDFIERAFYAARAADPDARLVINDYSIESSSNKVFTMYKAVKKMLEDGVPIDGVGFQCHIGSGQDIEKMRENMHIIAKLRDINPDLMIEVTELDMGCWNEDENGNPQPLTKEQQKQFDQTYTDLFNMLMDLSEEGILDSVVFWNIHDGVSWLNGNHQNYPLLIDRDLKLKDTFYNVCDLPGNR